MPTFTPENLEKITTELFRAAGASPEEAKAVATHLIDANLAGHDSHGFIRVIQYLKQIRDGVIKPGAKVEVAHETPTTAQVDGNWNLGQVVAKRAAELAIEKARKMQVGCVVARHLGHCGRIGAYAELAAAAGMGAMCCVGSGGGAQIVTPFGGRKARLSTNPMAMALPSGTEGPILMDFASSVAAEGKLRVYRARKKELPPQWIVNADGNPSTNPDDFYHGGALMPLGGTVGHKGFCLSFMVEALGGIVTRDGYCKETKGTFSNGFFIVVFNLEAFVPVETLKTEVADLARYVKTSPLADGFSEILYPGEKEVKTRKERRNSGIEVEDYTWGRVKEEIALYKLEQALAPLP
ncbi:MAG: Ldh family oxidoreductase [Chloroflexota bacterium]|nr:Ldh family oxidoreductase [Chloroflexota bacterium]